MGSRATKIVYEGAALNSIEDAAHSLETTLKSTYPNAFITIGDSDLNPLFSPRGSIMRVAFARIGDGNYYRVNFRVEGKSFRAQVRI